MNIASSTETTIPSITLTELTAQAGVYRQGIQRECIAVLGDTPLQSLPFLGRIDAFIIGVCTRGETTISLNLREYRITEGRMFIFGPRSIVQTKSTHDFQAYILALSSEFMRHIAMDTKRILQLFLQLADRPCIELRPEEGGLIGDYIRLIATELKAPEQQLTRDIVNELTAATIYKVADTLSRYIAEHPETEPQERNRNEEYFRKFIELLSDHYKKERSVNFYARQLCITPKYLTTIIKQISGKPVSDWIAHFVLLEAQSLLKYTNMSIQEISYHLNFPNQSFFGCYFKRLTGMSPSQYKAQG